MIERERMYVRDTGYDVPPSDQDRHAEKESPDTIADDLFLRLQVAWLDYQVEVQKTLRLQDQLQAQGAIAHDKEQTWNAALDQARTAHGKTDSDGIDMVHRVWVKAPAKE
jgi:hypothetical protein